MSWFRRSALQRHWKLIIYLIIYVFWSSRLFDFMKYNIRIDYKLFHTFQNWNQKIFRFYDILILSWVVLQLVRINLCQLLFLSLILSGSFYIFFLGFLFCFPSFWTSAWFGSVEREGRLIFLFRTYCLYDNVYVYLQKKKSWNYDECNFKQNDVKAEIEIEKKLFILE